MNITYDDGVVGNLLRVFAVVVESQVPDSRVEEADELGLVDVHGSRSPQRSLRFHQASLLLRDQAAAVQQLHEVVLHDTGTREHRINASYSPNTHKHRGT